MSNALGTITPLRPADRRGARGGRDRRWSTRAQLVAAPRVDVQAPRLRLPRLLRPQDARSDRERRTVRRRPSSSRRWTPVRRRRDDPRGLPRPLHLERRALQVRGRHHADRPADRTRRRGRLPRRRWAWTRCARTRRRSRGTRWTDCSAAGATVYGPKDVADRGGAVSFWYTDVHPHDLAHGRSNERGRRDPCRSPLRAARDAAVRRARHRACLVLRLQHQGRGRRAGRRARQGGRRLRF